MLAARHRARLAMQDSNEDTREVPLTRQLRAQNVRRRLFADETEEDRPEDGRGVDENRANEIFEETRENLEKAKERWNFDFANERPLQGKYEWVKCDKDGNEMRTSREDAAENEAEDRKGTSESGAHNADRDKPND